MQFLPQCSRVPFARSLNNLLVFGILEMQSQDQHCKDPAADLDLDCLDLDLELVSDLASEYSTDFVLVTLLDLLSAEWSDLDSANATVKRTDSETAVGYLVDLADRTGTVTTIREIIAGCCSTIHYFDKNE
jgi:hypothetical protein